MIGVWPPESDQRTRVTRMENRTPKQLVKQDWECGTTVADGQAGRLALLVQGLIVGERRGDGVLLQNSIVVSKQDMVSSRENACDT